MLLTSPTSNEKKLYTKEELRELLGRYKGILSNPMIEYLNSIIELEFSVVKENISENDRKALAELEIYKQAAAYNIYNRAIKLIADKKLSDEDLIKRVVDNYFIIYFCLDEIKSMDVFNFIYGDQTTRNIPDGYKTMKIGAISLFCAQESDEARKLEMERILNKLEHLYDTNVVISSRPGAFGGPNSYRKFSIEQEIESYEKALTKLDNKRGLSDLDKRKIEVSNRFHELIMEDYGFTSDDFKDEEKRNTRGDRTLLEKTLIKRQPNLIITDNIYYL